ncbi:MAG: DUF72 domain-containing protein [Hyphomonadaceae bacterium]|jgi:uncharacterized protein YecE (DUF72 family)|nr:DUF72 domain-containing protein [Hyphomonadaceae bacterium]
MAKQGKIRVGIGGWTFEPWRGVFYPKGLSQAKELGYASRHLTSIEINGTFYRTQTPSTFAKWREEVPEGFVFSVKGVRYAVNRSVLAEAGDSIKRFLESGVTELGSRLGPILWQFAATKTFDEADFGKFLELLPPKLDGTKLRHVVEPRHASFCTPAFIALIRQFSIPAVFAEHATYPAIPDPVGDVVYLRLQKGRDDIATGYPRDALNAWAERAKAWAKGGVPRDLKLIDPKRQAKVQPRDVFVYFIHEGKVRAPAAAMELIARVGK